MDRKTVADDALISTDIDAIIKYLSAKKRVDMGTLARELGMKGDALKKWIEILEDEGYVRVEYHLLSEYVNWAGGEITPVQEEEIEVRAITEERIHEMEKKEKEDFFSREEYEPKGQAQEGKPAAREAESGKEGKEEAKPFIKSYEPKHEDFKAEERVERIMERLGEKIEKEAPKEEPAELTRSIISSFSEDKSEEDKEHEEEMLKEALEHAKRAARAPKPQPPAQKKMDAKARMAAEKADEEVVSLKRSLSEYMEEIKVQKQEIEKLKSERERLLAEAYLPVESRFKASYDSIAEKLLEKEGRIIELKERLVALPAKIGETEGVENALRRIREESRRAVSSNREEMERMRKALKEEDARLKSELDSIEKDIKGRKSEMADIGKSLSELEQRELSLKKGVEDLNRATAEINEKIAASYASVSQLAQTRGELGRRLDNIRMTLDARGNEAAESYSRLQEVRKAEAVIQEYLSDYQKKVEDIEDYARESEKELARLKEAAEVKYMRGYIKELDSISNSYEHELGAVNAQERSVDERIREAQSSLESLLKESRTLVKSLEKKTSGADFDKIVSEVKARQEAMVATVREKSAEIEKAKEELPTLRERIEAAERKPAKYNAPRKGKKDREKGKKKKKRK